MGRSPREHFVPPEPAPLAYGDRPCRSAMAASLAPPAVTRAAAERIGAAAGRARFVVGAGTGYSAAVLAALGLEVTALESDPALASMAKAASPGCDVVEGDARGGLSRRGALRPHPDRRRGRACPRGDRRPACRRRAARRRAQRSRRHPAGRRPQGRRRVRASDDRRRRSRALARFRAARGPSHSDGDLRL